MTTALWAILAAVAVLWPARLAGPLDGAPLDQPLEAVVIGVLLPWLLIANARVLHRPLARGLIVALLAWKALTGAALTQDGWCVRFTSPTPLYLDDVLVPHSWDLRADWRSEVPRCSAVMVTSYPVLERFPVWFYNLPPANYRDPVRPGDRPPGAVLRMDLEGFVQTSRPGSLQIVAGEDVALSGTVDGEAVSHDALSAGVALAAGSHQVRITGALRNTHWSLDPRWDGRPVWTAAIATVDPPSAMDFWLRPWGRFVPALLVLLLGLFGIRDILRRAHGVAAVASAVALAALSASAASLGREPVTRALPAIALVAAAVALPRRLQNLRGFSLFVGLPFLALFMVRGAAQAGIFTWYSAGDDWWMFQRFAYRIYMQGHWLEGGEPTFWFQPFYRWVAGALHLIFGDSSVGELFWDAGAALAGSAFAFYMTKTVGGFRWGLAAGSITLTVFTLGPTWHLFGRGLSEFTSAGFLYAAALFALRGREGYWPAITLAGVLATLASYTRLNNLPMTIAVAAFAWPVRLPVSALYRPAILSARVSKRAVAGLLGVVALGLWLFTARTYYYTKVPSMLFGTQAGARSVLQLPEGDASITQNILGSLFMVLTMQDPPRFDVRAVPVLAGVAAAVAAVLGVGRLRRLPLNAVVFCLAGLSGALVARGSAYPGRFSVHLIPVAVTLAVSGVAVLLKRDRPNGGPRSPR